MKSPHTGASAGGLSCLGETEVGALLEKTLEEEKETDQKLTELAEEINASRKAKGSGRRRRERGGRGPERIHAQSEERSRPDRYLRSNHGDKGRGFRNSPRLPFFLVRDSSTRRTLSGSPVPLVEGAKGATS